MKVYRWVEKCASYYPNLSIANNLKPEHLGEVFPTIFKHIYDERTRFPKGSTQNALLKLALNGGGFGASNDKYSPFYDPQYTMAITVNGQLTLCMLIESICNLPQVTVLQANSDGATFKIPREYEEELDKKVKEWEDITKLTMEKVEYESMFVRDVNNYVAVTSSGKVKQKGAYEFKDLAWHKNQSCLIVPMAVEYEILGRGKAEDFIRNHKEKFDFMLRAKVPRSSKLFLITEDEYSDKVEIQQQNICRYYMQKEGGKLVKEMPMTPKQFELAKKKAEESGEDVSLVKPVRRIGIDTNWNVKICNNMVDFDWNLDYDYYISEANKLLKPVLHNLEVEQPETASDEE